MSFSANSTGWLTGTRCGQSISSGSRPSRSRATRRWKSGGKNRSSRCSSTRVGTSGNASSGQGSAGSALTCGRPYASARATRSAGTPLWNKPASSPPGFSRRCRPTTPPARAPPRRGAPGVARTAGRWSGRRGSRPTLPQAGSATASEFHTALAVTPPTPSAPCSLLCRRRGRHWNAERRLNAFFGVLGLDGDGGLEPMGPVLGRARERFKTTVVTRRNQQFPLQLLANLRNAALVPSPATPSMDPV
jgi:hypothetical protein